MKLIIILYGFFLLLSCNNNETTEKNKEESESPILVKNLSNKEVYNIKVDTLNEWTIKKNDTIRIKTKNQFIDFISHPNLDENESNYTYNGFNKNIGFHIVCGQYWEDYRCYLIDQETSRIDTLWTEPIFSPDNRYLISKSMDYGLEGIPNGFQIWHLNHKKQWIKVNEIDQQEWIPIDINWLTEDSIEINSVTIKHYNEMNWDMEKLSEFDKIKMKIK